LQYRGFFPEDKCEPSWSWFRCHVSPSKAIRSMSPGPDFRGADRERCVSYFTLSWCSKNALSAMAGRRKRLRCAGSSDHFSSQAYPSRPVRIIASAAAGTAMDVHGRLHGQWKTGRAPPALSALLRRYDHVPTATRFSSSRFRWRSPRTSTASRPTTLFTTLRPSLCSIRQTT